MTTAYLEVETQFTTALAMLSVIQDHFVDDRAKLQDDIIYFSLEGVRREIESIKTSLLIHGGHTK